MTATNQASSLNTQHSSEVHSWFVVLTAALFFFYIFIQIHLFNAINGELTKELCFNATKLGNLSSFYFYGSVFFLFPAGILLDRLSVRKLLLTAFIVTVIATYVFSITSSFNIMIIIRLAIGLVGAFSLLSVIKLASRWFEPHRIAVVIGIAVTMAMFGGALAQAPLALLTRQIGWRHAMQIITALGVLLIIVQFIMVHDEPKGLKKNQAAEHIKLEQFDFWRSLGKVIINKQNWLSGTYISLVNLPLLVLGAWGAPYLAKAHNFSQVQATLATSMLFIGMMIGSPLAGVISNKMGLRKLPMIVGAILTIAAILIIMFFIAMPLGIVVCQFLFLGTMMGSQIIGYSVITESNPHTITATATGLGALLVMFGGTLISIYSWLLSLSNNVTMVDNTKIYSLADFIRANCLMLTGLIIALIASLLIEETHCKFDGSIASYKER